MRSAGRWKHDPALAAAHYNLSFTLGQLGDFEGALRETKRALELESYYVPQKFALTIDLQYEDPDHRDRAGCRDRGGARVARRASSPSIPARWTTCSTSWPRRRRRWRPPRRRIRSRWRATTSSKGLLELATAEVTRAQGRGAGRAEAQTLLGEIYARRGLHGEALERFRTARESNPGDRGRRPGRAARAGGPGSRRRGRRCIAEQLLEAFPRDVEVLSAVARVRLAMGDARPRAQLRCSWRRRSRRDGSDLLHLQARVAVRLDDRGAAIEACRRALELDDSLVQVWYELGRLEEEREDWAAAQAAYARALDILPTYLEAGARARRPAAAPDAAPRGARGAGRAA